MQLIANQIWKFCYSCDYDDDSGCGGGYDDDDEDDDDDIMTMNN